MIAECALVLKISGEAESPNEGGVFKIFDEPLSPKEGACFKIYGERLSPTAGACLRYMKDIWPILATRTDAVHRGPENHKKYPKKP